MYGSSIAVTSISASLHTAQSPEPVQLGCFFRAGHINQSQDGAAFCTRKSFNNLLRLLLGRSTHIRVTDQAHIHQYPGRMYARITIFVDVAAQNRPEQQLRTRSHLSLP